MQAARRGDGAVLVEFALVLPVLLLLIVGMLQMGLAMNAKIDETHLTALGARYAAVNQNPGAPGTLQNYVRSRADTAQLRSEGTVCVEFPSNPVTGTSGKIGDPVRVTMTRDYRFAPIVGVGPSVTVTSEATMRIEALPTKYTANPPCPT